jgi:hypothetical protein
VTLEISQALIERRLIAYSGILTLVSQDIAAGTASVAALDRRERRRANRRRSCSTFPVGRTVMLPVKLVATGIARRVRGRELLAGTLAALDVVADAAEGVLRVLDVRERKLARLWLLHLSSASARWFRSSI